MITYPVKVWGTGHDNSRVITSATLALLERWELFMDHWYPDGLKPDGSILYSCMFGHAEGGDNPPFKYSELDKFTIGYARETLLADVKVKARWVDARIKVPLTTFMYGGLVSLCYQFGQGRLDAAQEGKHPSGKPLMVDGAHYKFPFIEQFNSGAYVDGITTILGLDFTTAGKVLKGLTVRRATEVGFMMTRID